MPYVGTAGNDVVRPAAPVSGQEYDLLGGTDRIDLAYGGSSISVRNVERVNGGSGDDTVEFLSGGGLTFYGGAGSDSLVMSAGSRNILLYDVESLQGSAGDDYAAMVFQARSGTASARIDGGAGFDTVIVFNRTGASSSLEVSGVEILGVYGEADVALKGGMDGGRVSALDGQRLGLALGETAREGIGNLLETSGVASVLGSSGRDVVRLVGTDETGRFDLGGGQDRLEMNGRSTHDVEVSGTEAVLGGRFGDALRVRDTVAVTMSVDLGEGTDILDLSGSAGGMFRVSNVEGVIGGSGSDTVEVRTASRGMELSLGEGRDTVLLSATGGNSVFLQGVEHVRGSAGTDRIAATDGTAIRMEGAGGADVMLGGSGDDVLVGGLGKDTMTGGAGADRFVFSSTGDSDLATRDIVADFQVGLDRLEFSGLLHGRFGLVVEDAFTRFQTNGNSQAHFVDSTDQLLIDTDGDGQMDMRMALLGVDGAALSVNDFIWSSGVA